MIGRPRQGSRMRTLTIEFPPEDLDGIEAATETYTFTNERRSTGAMVRVLVRTGLDSRTTIADLRAALLRCLTPGADVRAVVTDALGEKP